MCVCAGVPCMPSLPIVSAAMPCGAGSVDGLVEASRQSRVCGGTANEIMCAIFRVLMEVHLMCLVLSAINSGSIMSAALLRGWQQPQLALAKGCTVSL